MEKTAVQKLAGALKVLVTITLVCNLVALLLVPGGAEFAELTDDDGELPF